MHKIRGQLHKLWLDVKLTEHRFESMPSKIFKIFMEILQKYRGEFVSKAAERLSSPIKALLEGRNCASVSKSKQLEDTYALTNLPHDSPDLLNCCNLA